MFSLVDLFIVIIVLVITILIGFLPSFVKAFKKFQVKLNESNKRKKNNVRRKSTFNHETLLFSDINIEDGHNTINVKFENNNYEDIVPVKNVDFFENINSDKTAKNESYVSSSLNNTEVNNEPKANFFLNLISLVVGFQTPISIVGLPIEFYFFGFKSLQITLSIILAPILISLFFVPFLYKIKSKSIYDYLNDKFDGHLTVKNLAILLGVLFQFLFASMVLFSTSISITQIISLNYDSVHLWHVAFFLGIFSALLALLGLESVILANFVQYILMTVCNLLIIYFGIKNYDSKVELENGMDQTSKSSFFDNLNQMWNATKTTGRSEFLVLNETFKMRYTFWNCLIGLLFNALPSYCLTQQSFMRIKQAKSIRSARYLTLSILPISVLNLSLMVLIGFVMFSYFYKCGDPISLNLISSQNQLFAKFLTQFFNNYYGLLGLYIALVISSGIGTLSSVLKALSVTLSQDILIRVINMIKIIRKRKTQPPSKTMMKENSFLKQRRLSDKQNEIIYEEELITYKLTSTHNDEIDYEKIKKNKKKMFKKYLKRNYLTNKPTKKLQALLILVSALIISSISVYLNEIPGTITSIGFSLINSIHGPIFFIYLCAKFNDFSIKRYNYALHRSTKSKLRNFKFNHLDILLSCVCSILFVEFLFFGQLLTKNKLNGFYDSEKITMSHSLNMFYLNSFEDESLSKFCSHSNLTKSIFNSTNYYSNKSTYATSFSNLNDINFLHHLFSISFNWYSFIGFFICFICILSLNIFRLILNSCFYLVFKKKT